MHVYLHVSREHEIQDAVVFIDDGLGALVFLDVGVTDSGHDGVTDLDVLGISIATQECEGVARCVVILILTHGTKQCISVLPTSFSNNALVGVCLLLE
jgi:hypothetical protein